MNNKRYQIYIIALIINFSLYSYEVIIANSLSLLLLRPVECFIYIITVFILSLGFGTLNADKLKQTSLNQVLVFESISCFLGGFSTFFIETIGALSKNRICVIVIAGIVAFLLGYISGIETQLLIRMNNDKNEKINVFSIDYIGLFLSSIFTPLYILNKLNNIAAASFVSIIGLVSVFLITINARNINLKTRVFAGLSLTIVSLIFFQSWHLQNKIDALLLGKTSTTNIVDSIKTKYQKVTLAIDNQSNPQDKNIKLFLNNSLQFQVNLKDNVDYYHSAFTHPAILLSPQSKKILILGGGDGMIAKEILKYSDEKEITIIDIDEEFIKFAENNTLLKNTNNNALKNKNVKIITDDAFRFIKNEYLKYDIIYVDFPESPDFSLSRTYSYEFFLDIKNRLSETGIAVLQVDSFDDDAFWCAVKTAKATGFFTWQYKTQEPAVDEQSGIFLISKREISSKNIEQRYTQYSFLEKGLLPVFDSDIIRTNNEEYIKLVTKNLKINSYFEPNFLLYYNKYESWESGY